MREVSFCPASDTYTLFLRPDIFSFPGQSIAFNIADVCSLEIFTCPDLAGTLVFTDHRSTLSFSFVATESPFIVVTNSHVYIPSFQFTYTFDASSLFDHRIVSVTSTFVFFFKDVPLFNTSDKYIKSFLSNNNSSYLSLTQSSNSPAYLFAVVSNFADILSELSPPPITYDSELNSQSSSVLNVFNYNSSLPDEADNEDDLLSPHTLSKFLDENTILINCPIVLPSSTPSRPRLSILIYCFKSFLCHITILYRILFSSPRLLIPYLRSISQYLHGRNRYPFLTFFLPLLTSSFSIFFLSVSGSAPFLVYGAISYLVVARMLKVSYIATKVSRRIEADVFPVLFLSHIVPLYFLVFVLNLFSPLQFALVSILFYIYCQFFQYALKFSHFIGDVRMFYKLLPSIVFAFFSMLGLNNPSLFLPLSFLSVIIIMFFFPRLFRLQVL